MPLTLADLCPNRPVCRDPSAADQCGGLDCCACPEALCSCGLPWDPARGPHTLRGLRLTDEVLERIFDRELVRLRAEGVREAAHLADEERRRAVAEYVKAGLESLRFTRRRP